MQPIRFFDYSTQVLMKRYPKSTVASMGTNHDHSSTGIIESITDIYLFQYA